MIRTMRFTNMWSKKKIAGSFRIIYTVLQILLISLYCNFLSGCTGKLLKLCL